MSRRRQDSPLPYSKVMDPYDYTQLVDQLLMIGRYPEALAGQHDIRRWEYAMALRTISQWCDWRQKEDAQALDPLRILDVGGGGSNFWQVLTAVTSEDIVVVDPTVGGESPRGQALFVRQDVESYAAEAAHQQFDVITCISVIEHVEEVRRFFRACHMLLKPGGLLFLTTDYWDSEGPDTAHFHWMRLRIYNADRMRKLLGDLRELGYRSFGQADWAYHGAQVYDYSVCSAALTRRI